MLDGARFHHLGVACRDLDAEREAFSALGYRAESACFADPIQKVSVQFLVGNGPRIELIAPFGHPSPVEPWVKRGVKYYHQAYEVPSIEASVASAQASGGMIIGPAVPAVAFGGRRICFAMMPGSLLVEFVEL